MKKGVFLLMGFFVAMAAFPYATWAQYCGGKVEFNADCGNDRPMAFSCCPDPKQRVHGIAYTDIHKKDVVDGISVICRVVGDPNYSNYMVPSSDFQGNPARLECDKAENMIGIVTADLPGKDELDGVGPVCRHAKTKAVRRITGSDFGYGPEIIDRANRNIVGIAYSDKGNDRSDEADCVTIITK